MNINQLSNISNVRNYSKVNSLPQNSETINFQKAPKVLNKSLVTAALALASLGVVTSVNAQTKDADITKTDKIVDIVPNDVLGPQDNMGRYYETNGFTPEQRAKIADYTEEYAAKYYKKFQEGCKNAYENCSYFNQILDSPANPLALNSGYYMSKAEKFAKELTQFRQDMISIGAIRNADGHFMLNPELNPINDNKEEIEKILGTSYEQYMKDNAETIKKLDNLTLANIDDRTPEEMSVYSDLTKVYNILGLYIYTKGTEYTEEAKAGIEKHKNIYANDMKKLDAFRNEKNNTENTFVQSTLDGHGIITDFEDFHVDEGFNQAALKVFYEEILPTIPTEIKDAKADSDKGGLYDMSGKVVTDMIKSGIYIKDGKKIYVK